MSRKLRALSSKGLTTDLRNQFSLLKGVHYFSLVIFQNYLVFIPAKKYINYFSGISGSIRGNLMECQKEILKIYLNQTAISHQLLCWLSFITRHNF